MSSTPSALTSRKLTCGRVVKVPSVARTWPLTGSIATTRNLRPFFTTRADAPAGGGGGDGGGNAIRVTAWAAPGPACRLPARSVATLEKPYWWPAAPGYEAEV